MTISLKINQPPLEQCLIRFTHPHGIINMFATTFTKAIIKDSSGAKFKPLKESVEFSYDLDRMKACVECDYIAIPRDLTTAEELDAWLMGLELE